MALAGGSWGERTHSWANPIPLLGPHTPILLLSGLSSSVCLVPTKDLSPTLFPRPIPLDLNHSFIHLSTHKITQ